MLARASLPVGFGAGVAAFATALGAVPVWLLLAPVAVSMFVRWELKTGTVLGVLRRVLWLLLILVFLLGWVLMAVPVLRTGTIQTLSAILGYGLAALGTFFLLTRSGYGLPSTSVPAMVGLFVIGSFQPDARLVPWLVVAGASALAHLAATIVPRDGERSNRRLVLLTFYVTAIAVTAGAIIDSLPSLQGKVGLR